MTDVNRYRDGEMSSTALMQRAMEEAHAVPEGEGKNVKWHADHESMDQARARMHDEPRKALKLGLDAAAGCAAETFVKKTAKSGFFHVVDVVAGTGYADAAKAMSAAKRATAAAVLSEVGAGAALVFAAVAETVHGMNQGDELHDKSDVDAMDVAVTNLLDLDPAFKDAVRAKHPWINSQSTMSLFLDSYGKPNAFGSVHIPELQAAADAGSRAALDAMRCGGREAYFAAHPDARERLANDIAFNKGFENVMFLAGRREDEKVRAVETTINERNVSANVAVPGRG